MKQGRSSTPSVHFQPHDDPAKFLILIIPTSKILHMQSHEFCKQYIYS